jgi:hypothetical protein
MARYKIALPATARTIRFDGLTEHIVEDISSAAALLQVKAVSSKDMDVVWDQAVITEIVQDMEGVVFTLTVDALGTPAVFAYTGLAEDTWADVGTALEVLCEVDYTSSWTPEATHGKVGTLLVATGSGTDDIGDKTLAATAVGPNGEDLTALFFANIVSEGNSTDDMTIDLLADCPTPRVIGSYK